MKSPLILFFLETNPAFEKLTGVRHLRGQSVHHFFPVLEGNKKELYDIATSVALSGMPQKVEMYIYEMKIWISCSIISPQKGYCFGIINDITPRKNAELALKESELKYTTLFENSSNGNIIIDTDGNYLEVNNRAAEVMGTTPEQIIGKNIADFIPVELVEKHLRTNRELLEKGESREYEETFKMGDTEYSFNISDNPIKGNDGRYFAIQSVIHDITKRKKTEDRFKENEQYLSSVLSAIPDLMFVLDANGVFIDSIINSDKNYDYPGESFLGKNLFDVLPNTNASLIQEKIQRVLLHQHTHPFECQFEIQGNTEYFECKMAAFGETKVIAMVSNISERKKAQIALENNRLELKTIYDNTPVLMCVLNRELKIVYSNQLFNQFINIPANEMINGIPGNIMNCINATNNEKGCGYSVECKYCRLRYIINDTFKTGIGHSNFEHQMHLLKDGKKMSCWLLCSTALEQLSDSQNLLLCMYDITKRKQTEKELNESNDKLSKFAIHLQNVREEERSLLAREIHDDLGQILVALKIDIGLLHKKVVNIFGTSDSNEVVSNFEKLMALFQDTIKTTRRIITGLRSDQLELLGFNQALIIYLDEFKERFKIDCHFKGEDLELKLNPLHSLSLYRIFQESLNNIVKHAQATEVTVQLKTADSLLIMEIRDNGIGFDQGIKMKNDTFGIVGMKERVLIFDGEFFITSAPGRGTTVRIEMPYKMGN